MSRGRKAAIAVLGGLVVLVIAGLLVPRVADLSRLRARIVAQLSERLGAQITIATLRLSLLPLPHVVLGQVALSLPDGTAVAIASVSAYPRLLPLLAGKLQVAKLQVASPNVTARLTQRGAAAGAPLHVDSAGQLRDAFVSAIGTIAAVAVAEAPELVLAVNDGRLTVAAGDRNELELTNVRVRMGGPPGPVSIDLTCASKFWDQLSLRLSLDPSRFAGSGRIDVTRLRPQLISAELIPAGDLQFGDFEATLHLNLRIDGPKELSADIAGAFPALALHRGPASQTIKGGSVKAALHLSDTTTHIEIGKLDLEDPELQLSGDLVVDHAAPHAHLELRTQNLDVAPVRAVAVLVAGETSILGGIFDVVRAGKVPQLTLHARGQTVADLWGRNALAIRGTLNDGLIHIPGIAIVLEEVNGDVSVADGLLAGEHVAARLGNSRAHGGTLRLGLGGPAPELRVETQVEADAADLPGLLRTLVPREPMLRGAEQLSDIAGTAVGQLILDGTTKHLNATVDVSQFHVSARVPSVEPVVRIEGGRLLYGPQGLTLDELTVTAGPSTLSQFSGRLDWNTTPATLEIAAGSSRIVLGEVYPWLVGAGWLGGASTRPRAFGGTLDIQSLRAGGPIGQPSAWRFEVRGAARNFELESPLIGKRVALRSPLMLSDVSLRRDPSTGASFAGKVVTPDGLAAAIDVRWNGAQLNLKRFDIHDAHSDASLSLLASDRSVDAAFKGTLTRETVEALVADNPFLKGWVRGDFRTRIRWDQPTQSVAEGRLEARGLLLFEEDGARANIESATLNARAGTIDIDATIDAAEDTQVHVLGTVKPSPQTFVVDLDLISDHLSWDRFAPGLQWRGPADRPNATADGWRSLLRGSVRLTATSLTYGRFTWHPLRATVALSPNGPAITVTDANLCGITTRGKLAPAPSGMTLVLKPTAHDRPVDATLSCLLDEKGRVTGRYDLKGDFTARGEAANIVQSVHGHAEIQARAGRIFRLGVLAQVFSVLGVASGSLQNIPDLAAKGLPYDTLQLKVDVQGRTLVLREAVMDGPSVKMVGQGTINLSDRTADVTLLVAPLRSVDSVVSRIPVIGDVLGGSLVSIPVRVSGALDNPTVTPLPAAAVGSELLGVMKRTLKLPVEAIQPLLK